jgi:HAE1 family hydrophobic/amphiphilic exporter-1
MKNFLRFTISQTVFINIIFILLMVIGAYALLRLPVDRYPNVNFGKAQIEAFFPGASPQDVEALVTEKIEDALEDLEQVEFIKSTSYRERAIITVKFIDDSDYHSLYDELRLKVLGIQNELPNMVDPPTFTLIDTDDWLPVMSVNLVGARDNRSLALMAEELKTNLETIPGVREVETRGEYTREYHIILDSDLLKRFGITFNEVATALTNANLTIPAGDFATNDGEYVIVVDEQFRTREQIAETIVRNDGDGSFVKVGDLLQDAYMHHRDPVVISSVNGQSAVTLSVLKEPWGNSMSIYDGVVVAMEPFRRVFEKEGVELVITQDSTVIIEDVMRTLISNLAIGIFLVALLIWAFMGFRNAALTVIGVPFSFLVTMIFMYLTGNSLNEITLFSFVLVSGILVDDAIVVVENIYRHVRMHKPIAEAVVDGTAEVFLPVVSATATTVAAFLPMLIMTGSTGEFFALIPKAVTFALVASLIECLIILPIHYMDYGPREKQAKQKEAVREFALMRWFRKPARFLIRLGLRFRWVSLGAVGIAFSIAIFIFAMSASGKANFIRIEFFPGNYNQYFVDVELPSETPIERTNEVLKEIGAEVVGFGPGKTNSLMGYAGFVLNEDYEPNFNGNVGHLVVTLPATKEREFADYPKNDPKVFLDWVAERLQKYEDRGYEIRIHPEQDGPPSGKDVNIRTVGANAESVERLSDALFEWLKSDPELSENLTDIQSTKGLPSRVFRFDVDPERAAEYRVTPAQIASLSAAALNGRYIGEFRDNDEQVDMKLKLSGLKEPNDALSIHLIEHPSGPVRLGDLANTEVVMETGYMNRFNGERAVAIKADLKANSDLTIPMVIARVSDHYDQIRDQYPGATLNFAGEFADTRRSYTSLGYAFVIALLLMYLILASQFHSYLQPMIVLSTVIFALIGVIFGAFFSQTLFTVNSFIAIVGVTGVVVNDSLVLVEFLNKLRREGKSRKEAIIGATEIRMQPILLTTLTTTLGLLPMALGIPEYSLTWGAMASTFVTGLCTATFLTILIVPVQWDLLEEAKEIWEGKPERHAKVIAEEMA